MKKMKIALTGGIGSGKSTVAEMIAEEGFPVFSCDDIYKRLSEDTEYAKKIETAFPGTTGEGKINKVKLSQIVFHDKRALKKLDSIAHPLVMEKLEKQMNEAQSSLVFAEVPLLFEGNFEDRFDKILVVLREKKDRIAAVAKRDGLNESSVIARINSQYDYDRFFSVASSQSEKIYILKNNSDQKSLKFSVNAVLRSLKGLL